MSDQELAAPEPEQIAPSEQNGDTAPATPDTTEPVAADPTEPVAEETDEQKNDRELKAREQRSEKAQRGIQRRFSEMAEANRQERESRLAAERRNDALIAALTRGAQQPQGQAGNGEPQRTQFDDYEKFIEARAEWKADQRWQQREAERNQQWQQHTQNTQASEMARNFETRMTKSAKAIPDFMEIIEDNRDVFVGNAVPAIAESDNPAGLMVYFAQNREAAARIANLSPIAAAREVGKIELQLKAKPQISNAPPPGKPVGAKPGTSSAPPEDPDAYMEWAAKNMKR